MCDIVCATILAVSLILTQNGSEVLVVVVVQQYN
jgi:hypothetical protein